MRRSQLLLPGLFLSILGLGACQSEAEQGLPQASALVRRAEAALREGQLVEAETAFRNEIQTRPTTWLAWIGLTRVGLAKGDLRLVESALDMAQQLTTKSAAQRELLARTMLEVARATEGGVQRQHALMAARMLLYVQRSVPETPRLDYHVGVAELILERPDSAARLARSELQGDPTFEPAWNLYVEALAQQGMHAAIVEVLAERESLGSLTPELSRRLEAARSKLPAKAPGARHESRTLMPRFRANRALGGWGHA